MTIDQKRRWAIATMLLAVALPLSLLVPVKSLRADGHHMQPGTLLFVNWHR